MAAPKPEAAPTGAAPLPMDSTMVVTASGTKSKMPFAWALLIHDVTATKDLHYIVKSTPEGLCYHVTKGKKVEGSGWSTVRVDTVQVMDGEPVIGEDTPIVTLLASPRLPTAFNGLVRLVSVNVLSVLGGRVRSAADVRVIEQAILEQLSRKPGDDRGDTWRPLNPNDRYMLTHRSRFATKRTKNNDNIQVSWLAHSFAFELDGCVWITKPVVLLRNGSELVELCEAALPPQAQPAAGVPAGCTCVTCPHHSAYAKAVAARRSMGDASVKGEDDSDNEDPLPPTVTTTTTTAATAATPAAPPAASNMGAPPPSPTASGVIAGLTSPRVHVINKHAAVIPPAVSPAGVPFLTRKPKLSVPLAKTAKYSPFAAAARKRPEQATVAALMQMGSTPVIRVPAPAGTPGAVPESPAPTSPPGAGPVVPAPAKPAPEPRAAPQPVLGSTTGAAFRTRPAAPTAAPAPPRPDAAAAAVTGAPPHVTAAMDALVQVLGDHVPRDRAVAQPKTMHRLVPEKGPITEAPAAAPPARKRKRSAKEGAPAEASMEPQAAEEVVDSTEARAAKRQKLAALRSNTVRVLRKQGTEALLSAHMSDKRGKKAAAAAAAAAAAEEAATASEEQV